ncbi:MAG: LPS export ABC transporter periplasmic protein LptC [Verrucomicrobia bacterium]|nr:LPS export ABC transporter periplasmic protein LptC [Verrucomicrobiota bacterium]
MLRFSRERARRVLFCTLIWGHLLASSSPVVAQQNHKAPKKKGAAADSASPSTTPASEVPLPVGHEAKGLVFPDFDENGQLRGRFTAGTARRVDQDHMEFRDLNITTYTVDNKVDLEVNMTESILDLNTHVLSSPRPTTIKRTDFQITGDRARFDIAARHGTLTGNVKMVITDAAKFTSEQNR